MTHYLIHFNQQWVGDHPDEWFEPRGPLARAVVDEMRAAGVLVFADGLEEDISIATSFDPTTSPLTTISGPFNPATEFVGGMTIVNVPTEAEALFWGQKIAVACGWPQEVRAFKS